MKKTLYRAVLLTLLCVGTILLFTACTLNPLKPVDLPDTLTAGTTFSLSFTYKGEAVAGDTLYYASENTSVATVSDSGVITAIKEGETKIHVQHKENSSHKTEISVKVVYDVKDEIAEFFKTSDSPVNAGDNSTYPFYGRNDYAPRVDDWDIIEIVKIVAGKSEGDYIFTDVYSTAVAHNSTYITISDWGNGDVSLDPKVLDTVDLSEYLTQRAELKHDGFTQAGEDIATRKIKTDIADQMQKLGYSVALSELSSDYEYRITVKVDYRTYRTVNFYSRGLVKGSWNVLVDLFKMDITSFLNSYTYNEVLHEIVLEDCDLVIERRPK